MIISELTGGLGNQMFQYAMGFAASKREGVNFSIDISGYKKHKKRKYGLNNFNIETEIADSVGLIKIKYLPFFGRILRETRFEFCPEHLLPGGNVYIENSLQSWQSEKYFYDFKTEILKRFSLKKENESECFYAMKEKISAPNSVSVHIRRGDYIHKQNTYFLLDYSYYEKAFKMIGDKIQSVKYFLFSDDEEWVKNKFPLPRNHEIVSGQNFSDAEEMCLQSSAQHHIIANSSFSWWGAYLGEYVDSLVIAPKNWFRDEKINTKDLIPEHWKII
jgi:hypothetical protein